MNGIFPMIQPELVKTSTDMPLYKEVAWDFKNGKPILQAGEPVIVSGAEAIQVWAWKALMTQRRRFEIYTWNFGSDLETLIGQNYIEETKKAEAVRYVREALEINPYITSVGRIRLSFADAKLTIEAALNTVYGEVRVYV